jgi:hypothetical protein
MFPDNISSLELQLRHAVAGNGAEPIGPALAAYCEACDRRLGSFEATDPLRRDLLLRVLQTLEWANSMMAISRARCLENYTQAARLKAYLQAIPSAGTACGPQLSRR